MRESRSHSRFNQPGHPVLQPRTGTRHTVTALVDDLQARRVFVTGRDDQNVAVTIQSGSDTWASSLVQVLTTAGVVQWFINNQGQTIALNHSKWQQPGDMDDRIRLDPNNTRVALGDGTNPPDVGLYRVAADTLGLMAGDSLQLTDATGLKLDTGNWIDSLEIADPAAPAANHGRLYFKDNGAGKTQLVALFNTGAVQVIATEP